MTPAVFGKKRIARRRGICHINLRCGHEFAVKPSPCAAIRNYYVTRLLPKDLRCADKLIWRLWNESYKRLALFSIRLD